ncbi:hypothetical protein BH23CHL2_BH23CHL2_02100 [soil metagenome]
MVPPHFVAASEARARRPRKPDNGGEPASPGVTFVQARAREGLHTASLAASQLPAALWTAENAMLLFSVNALGKAYQSICR